MPDILSPVDLSKYRLDRANNMLAIAKRDLNSGDYASANNRAYYCIFHCMRAVFALDGIDFKKHSAVISMFSKKYIKNGIFSGEFGPLL